MKKIFWFSLVAFFDVAFGHELCLDFASPFVQSGSESGFANFALCPQYNGARTCFGPEQEEEVVNEVLDSILEEGLEGTSAECVEKLQQLSCARLDGWSAHLFEAEGAEDDGRELAVMCPDFCSSVYDSCHADVLELPEVDEDEDENDDSRRLSVQGRLDELFTKEEFCNLYGVKNASVSYCFDGNPYEPKDALPYHPDFDLCFDKIIDEPAPLIIEPVPEKEHFMAIGFQNGIVNLFNIETGVCAETMMNLTDRVKSGGERGLLGMQFHPERDLVYVSYSCQQSHFHCTKTGNSLIEEYRYEVNIAGLPILVKNSSRKILEVEQPFANHNGGQILFGPRDTSEAGKLYLMFGDGGSANDPRKNGQNLHTLLGKILRIIPTTPQNGLNYTIPNDNPFVGHEDEAVRREIYAYGMRNPWRCSFDRAKKNPTFLYCGDVGQNKVEEVDIITSGGNYGWRVFEGSLRIRPDESLTGTGHIPPIIEYTHEELGLGGKASITGGFVYRGDRAPELEGNYIFGDFYDVLFLGKESPENSGRYVKTRVGFECSMNGMITTVKQQQACTKAGLGGVFSFGQSRDGDVFVGGLNGLYRVTSVEECLPQPTASPTKRPTNYPTGFPTTSYPTSFPTVLPTPFPSTGYPTTYPSAFPTSFPSTSYPTTFPITETPYPTSFPVVVDEDV